MRKKLYATATAITAGLLLALAFATPAQAHVVHVFNGDLGHGWTNTAHTRIGVDDTKCDALGATTEAVTNRLVFFDVSDPNGCDGGTGAKAAPAGQTIIAIRVCVKGTELCSAWKDVT